MKVSNQMLLLSLACLGFAACSEDNPWRGSEGEGGISLKLQTSVDVRDAVPLLRSGAPQLEAPDAADFSVSLENIATEELKTWNTLTDFNSQSSFPTGSYTLTAFYGSMEEEGFEKPFFSGSTEITVLEARQTDVELTASLANSMVSIEYTDAFKDYFLSYTPTVHSEGHSYIEFASDETRPAFIAPGEVSLTIDVTNPSGKSVTLQPASFPAEARHHYHITFDVNRGPQGDNQLQIVFDDSLVTEDVTIDLTEELFSSPAPAVNAEGFTDGAVLEALEGNPLKDTVRFNVIARGGITSAILTVAGDNFTPAFGNEIDLVKATPAQQEQISALGIKVLGLYKNPQSLAYVDLTNFAGHLPEGKASVSLVVKDAFTRVSKPLTVNFTNVPVELSAADGSAILGVGEAAIEVAYNGLEPEKNITFKALNRAGVYQDCEVLSVQESALTRSFESKNYIFTVKLPDTAHEVIPVKVYFGGKEKAQVNVEVSIPEYEIDVDAFGTYARVKVLPVNPSELAVVTNSLRLTLNGQNVKESDMNRNPESGIITLNGLNPTTSYTLAHDLVNTPSDKKRSFTTEALTALTNGDFSATHNAINQSNVEVGGKYSYTVAYQATSNIIRDEADGWATINAKTCWFDCPGAKNTWFQVPSTYAEGGEVVLRNVAYDHNGVKPAGMPTGFGKTYWYNTNVPAFTNFAAGELFLGSYAFNGNEERVEGVEFGSRPTSLSFDYAYAPEGNDNAEAEVSVLDASGAVIASGIAVLESSASMKGVSISLAGYPFGKKAAKIKVGFRSSNGSAPVHIPQGSELSEGFGSFNFGNKNLGDNNYHAVATGSVLRIDNVKLNY